LNIKFTALLAIDKVQFNTSAGFITTYSNTSAAFAMHFAF